MKRWLQYPLVTSLCAGRCLARGLPVALVLFAGMAWAEVLPYRVAGIFAVDGEQYQAVIELSADEQGLYREGDSLGSGTILEVSPAGVTVAVGSDRYFLALRGDGSAVYHEYKDPAAPATASTEVNYDYALKQLSAARADASKKDDSDALRRIVNRILRLPGQARITAIDRAPVESELAMIDTLTSALGSQASPQLLISGVPGMEEVYVLPSPVSDEKQ
ncbi:MAG: hypothetical protein BMS9Abin08_0306 [Gammaproteobacteria bacterium]|nr:MAG: hypothetical protein BMS9Abin08_0306 [Gammaproteobacteria bacterium]